MKIDSYGHQLMGIDHAHFAVHAGKLWSAQVPLTNVATATTTDIGILTGARELHFFYAVETNQGIQTISLVEGPTSVAAGSDITPYNHNRNGGTALTCAIKTGVTGATGGTTVRAKRIFGVSTGQREAGSLRQGAEWVLKANTQYVLRVLTGASGGNHIDVEMEFYETGVRGQT